MDPAPMDQDLVFCLHSQPSKLLIVSLNLTVIPMDSI